MKANLKIEMHDDSTGDRICVICTDEKGEDWPVTITWGDTGFHDKVVTHFNTPIGAYLLHGVASDMHLIGLVAMAMQDAMPEGEDEWEQAFKAGPLHIEFNAKGV